MKIKVLQELLNDVEVFNVYLNEALVATFYDKDSAVEHMKKLVTAKLEEND